MSAGGVTGAELLVRATRALTAAQVPDAARDARRLLAHVLGLAPGRLTLVLPDPVTPDAQATYFGLIERRGARVPVSHLTGRRHFYGRDFVVTADVLDPRPETETLIAAVLAEPFERMLDLGTGSGCILLTLLAERTGAQGIGTDLSAQALSVAMQNRTTLQLEDRATFLQGSWFDPVQGRFDLIVSNPPYIAAKEMADLTPEVREHEPRMALTDGDDGLTAYRAIFADAHDHLTPNGRLLVEIGHTQGAAVSDLMRAAGLEEVRVIPDLDGRDRVVLGRRAQGVPNEPGKMRAK